MAQRGRFVFGEVKDYGYSTLPIQSVEWDEDDLKRVFSANMPAGGQPKAPAMLSIEIPNSLKEGIRKFLDESLGLSASSLFPDLPGFAQAHGLA